METNIILLKIGMTFLLSLIFGIERQFSNKSIGFGTFTFVATGSCALGIVATDLAIENGLSLLGAIVTGIGFLGAGALIRTTDKIFGFTTAAGIWLFAIFGMIMGLGEYVIANVLYIAIWVVILIDRFLETRGVGSYQRKITITTKGVVDKKDILPVFGKRKWKLLGLMVDKKKKKEVITYLLNGSRKDVDTMQKEFSKKKWVETVKIE